MNAPRRRVAVTRDEPEDGPLARALRAQGLEPLACPAVSTAPPADPSPMQLAAALLGEYDWLVLASARAVRALVTARRGAPWPARLRHAAVGQATARALVAAGVGGPIVTGPGGASGLLEALRAADAWSGRSVLLPRADAGLPTLSRGLRALGARVDEVVAYRTVPVAPASLVRAWHAVSPDAAVVTSPSAAAVLLQALGARALSSLRGVVVIGATTAAPLRAAGVPVVVASATRLASVAEAASALWAPGVQS
jgi:uroporphyrinogen-III synthase